MKNTYNFGRTVSVEIEAYFTSKYEATEEVFENAKKVRYDGLKYYEIIDGIDAKGIEIEMEGAGLEVDPYHEYLVLHFEDGEQATFRNSCVDMFRVR